MNILVITHNNNEKSGANKSLLSLLNEWKDKYTIDVIVNRTDGNLPQEILKLRHKIIKADYAWNCVPTRQSGAKNIAIKGRGWYRYIKGNKGINKLIRRLRGNNYDLIYSNTSVIDLGARLAKKMNIPHVWHIREFGEEDFNFRFLISNRKRCKYLTQATSIITVSDALKEKYSKMLIDTHMFTIYNGLDIEKYICDISYKENNPLKVLIAGQISSGKGQQQAINAIVKLHKNYNIELYIAGKGDFNYLTNALAEVNNPEYIKVLGQVDNLYELRKNIDIELVCSKSEAFGRVTLEAMLHGIPVIGAATGGTKELIKDRDTGLLYKFNDIDELSECVKKLVEDVQFRYKIAKNGQEFAKQFTILKTASQVSGILDSSILY